MEIPNSVADDEILVRSIHCPRHINKPNSPKPRKAAFKSPKGKDEVSVTRLLYSSLRQIKSLASIIDQNENEKPNKSTKLKYVGMAWIQVNVLRKCCTADPTEEQNGQRCADAKSTPLETNPAHADIVYGIPTPIEPKEVSDPNEVNVAFKMLDEMIQEVVNHIQYEKDMRPEEPDWHGTNIK